MSKSNSYIITILSICVFFGGAYKYLIGTGIRADVFLFYLHPNGGRLVSNILLDCSNMITIATILYLWYSKSMKSTRSVILPFLIISVLDILDYFLFYKQLSVYKLPLLIVLILIFNFKCQSRKQ